jgi:hypothetical protein
MCQHRLLPQNGTCPNMPNTRCRHLDDAIFDDATTSITTRCLAVMTKSLSTGQIFHDKIYYGQMIKLLYARKKFPGFDRGSGYS